MNSPFKNDPFAMVYQAFKNLYPDKDCVIYWKPNLKDKNGVSVYGTTIFVDDGSIIIAINPELKVCDAIEILGHELAHVAVGVDAGHGPEWETAFDAIGEEYDRIGKENFDFWEVVEDE